MASRISIGPLARTFGLLACSSALTIGLAALAHGAEGAALDTIPAGNSFETIPAGEAAQIDDTDFIMTELQDKRRDMDPTQNQNLLRGVHPKSHGCVRATFTIDSNLDPQYRVRTIC